MGLGLRIPRDLGEQPTEAKGLEAKALTSANRSLLGLRRSVGAMVRTPFNRGFYRGYRVSYLHWDTGLHIRSFDHGSYHSFRTQSPKMVPIKDRH